MLKEIDSPTGLHRHFSSFSYDLSTLLVLRTHGMLVLPRC